MTDQAADAFLRYGALRCWQGGAPVTSIGITLGHGSWPVYEAKASTRRVLVHRNPALVRESGRWQNIAGWGPVPVIDNGGMIDAAVGAWAAFQTIWMPLDPTWKQVGGTQGQSSDNGMIIVDGPNRWEVQGLAPSGSNWRVDAISYVAPGRRSQGSQGPWSKLDGLMRPSWLSGPWPGPVRLVTFNPQYGPGARAVSGARVEHPRADQREAWVRAILPTGDDPRMIPCGQVLRLDITDAAIERWLDAEKVPTMSQLRVAKRWFAHGLRDHGMRLSETGTGDPILESSGGANPVEMAAWRDRGVVDEATANNLGRGIFGFGELRAA